MIESGRYYSVRHESEFRCPANRHHAVAKCDGPVNRPPPVRKRPEGRNALLRQPQRHVGVIAVFLRLGHTTPVHAPQNFVELCNTALCQTELCQIGTSHISPPISTSRAWCTGAAYGKVRPAILPSTASAVPARRISRARGLDPV